MFPSFNEYDNWFWHCTGNHATLEQYDAAKARHDNITSKAEAICQK